MNLDDVSEVEENYFSDVADVSLKSKINEITGLLYLLCLVATSEDNFLIRAENVK